MKSKRLRAKGSLVDKILFRQKKLLKENQITYFDKFYGPATLRKPAEAQTEAQTESHPEKKEESNLGVSSYKTENSASFADSFDEDFNMSEDSQGSVCDTSKAKSTKTQKKAKSVASQNKNRKEKYFKKGFDIFSLNFDTFKQIDKKEIRKKFVSKKKKIYEPTSTR